MRGLAGVVGAQVEPKKTGRWFKPAATKASGAGMTGKGAEL